MGGAENITFKKRKRGGKKTDKRNKNTRRAPPPSSYFCRIARDENLRWLTKPLQQLYLMLTKIPDIPEIYQLIYMMNLLANAKI